jgi:peptidoglycan-associated lipoprotein
VRTLYLALAVMAFPLTGFAADDAMLEFHVGPLDPEGVVPRGVEARLDGKPLPLPAPIESVEAPRLQVPLPSGPHAVDVEILLDGTSGIFSYIDDYRFKLKGHLDVQARQGEVIAVTASVERSAGFLVPWESRYRLVFSATSHPSVRPGQVQAASTQSEPVPAPVPSEPAAPASPAAVARAAPVAAVSPACALEPVNFDYGRATLGGKAKAALDRFAACLGEAGGVVRLEGHCDEHGSEAFNQRLGQRRADAAAGYLKARGSPGLEISTGSWGKRRPLCSEATRSCAHRNRRVAAILLGP